jgi:SPP1 family predicted phage head-tail adaptor
MQADNSLMQAGLLDRKITIEQLGPDEDDGLRVKQGWTRLCDRKAALVPLSGAEKIAAGQRTAFQTQKFRIRRPSAFTLDQKQHRLRYRGHVYDITNTEEVRRDEIVITGTAQADSEPAG